MNKEASGVNARLMEVEAQRSVLLCQLDTLNAERYQLQLKKHGITIGMLAKDSKNGKVYKVTGALSLDWERPWLVGRIQRKDGSFGVLERTVYDWVKMEGQS